jgi:hypothetical protein
MVVSVPSHLSIHKNHQPVSNTFFFLQSAGKIIRPGLSKNCSNSYKYFNHNFSVLDINIYFPLQGFFFVIRGYARNDLTHKTTQNEKVCRATKKAWFSENGGQKKDQKERSYK